MNEEDEDGTEQTAGQAESQDASEKLLARLRKHHPGHDIPGIGDVKIKPRKK